MKKILICFGLLSVSLICYTQADSLFKPAIRAYPDIKSGNDWFRLLRIPGNNDSLFIKRLGYADFANTPIGDFPEKWNTNSSGEIVTIPGKEGRWLSLTKPGVFVPEFTGQIPEECILEFDLLHDVPVMNASLVVSLSELLNTSQPQHFWNGKNRVNFEFNTANTGSKTGIVRANQRKNHVGETGNLAYTEKLNDEKNPVHITIWRQRERVRVFIDHEKIWDIPKALAKDASLNAIVFYTANTDIKSRHYLGNISFGEQQPFSPRLDSIFKTIKPGISLPDPNTGNPILDKPVLPKSDSVTIIRNNYDFSSVNLCIDMPEAGTLPPRPVVPMTTAVPKIKTDGELEEIKSIRDGLTGLTEKMWNPGETIKVGFLKNNKEYLVKLIKKYVLDWEAVANLKFDFVDDVTKAQIKITFDDNTGTSWSKLGRDVLFNPFNDATMLYGLINLSINSGNFKGTVLHEFGHAIGFVHEHQSPYGGIAWDKEKVYSYFAQKPIFWSRSRVDEQVFSKYSATHINSSVYDRKSIMHYFFPASLTTDGSSFSINNVLSATDSAYARLVYPFPPEPKNATGILRTGDDCDEIVFSVEYNAEGVADYEIEFVLEPGIDHHGNWVTWWKRIGIPLKGGGEAGMEMQAKSTDTRKINLSLIDNTRGISFWKAKFLGVHTQLSYQWNVMKALLGGSRVRLVWKRDTCL